MKPIHFSLTTDDHVKLHGVAYEPEGTLRGVVCLVHGLGEHTERYLHVGETFSRAGYALVGCDLRGHGRSEGLRGHTPSYERLLDDITTVLNHIQMSYGERPLAIYGHSLGGNLSLNYLLRRSFPNLRGGIITGPWLRLAFEPPAIKVVLGRLMNRLFPAFIQPSGLDTKALARDEAVVTAYETDPLVHDRISARLFMEAYQAGLWALEHAADLRLPVLLMHGTADRLTSAEASREFAERAGDRVTLRLWNDFYHEIHNESEKAEVLATMVAWLQEHL